MKHSWYLLFALLLVTLVSSAGCGQASGETNPSPTPAPSTNQPVVASPDESNVARIVFVGQAQACDCTRTRIDGSWRALQAALGEGSDIAVERLERDRQPDEVEEYRMLRPFVTVPAIYLLDENGAIVELLQGEVTEAQVRAALGGRS